MSSNLAIVNLARHRLTPLLTGGERHRRLPLPGRYLTGGSVKILFERAYARPHPPEGDLIHRSHCHVITPAHPDGPGGPAYCMVNARWRRTGQRIVTGTGCEAMPFATTTSVLGPAGVPVGMVNLVDEAAPGAIETDVQLLVRA